MSERAVNIRKIYVDYQKGESKTCLIHGPGHSSDELKVLGEFSSNYVKTRPTKYRRNNPVLRNRFNRQQENNSIVNSAVD